MDTLFNLEGRTALITGSSRGIGRAIAERMAQAGARVVVSSRKLDACEEVVATIRNAGGEAIAVPCNISTKAELEVLVARMWENPEIYEQTVRRYPLRRIGEPLRNRRHRDFLGRTSGKLHHGTNHRGGWRRDHQLVL